jgi:hypothetical protein
MPVRRRDPLYRFCDVPSFAPIWDVTFSHASIPNTMLRQPGRRFGKVGDLEQLIFYLFP